MLRAALLSLFPPFSSEVRIWAFVFRHRFCFPPSSLGLLLYSVLLSVKFFLHREDFLCLSFVIFVTFVVRGLLSLAPSRPFLMVRFGFCSLSTDFWFPLSGLCYLCSSAFQRSCLSRCLREAVKKPFRLFQKLPTREILQPFRTLDRLMKLTSSLCSSSNPLIQLA